MSKKKKMKLVHSFCKSPVKSATWKKLCKLTKHPTSCLFMILSFISPAETIWRRSERPRRRWMWPLSQRRTGPLTLSSTALLLSLNPLPQHLMPLRCRLLRRNLDPDLCRLHCWRCIFSGKRMTAKADDAECLVKGYARESLGDEVVDDGAFFFCVIFGWVFFC